MKKNGYAGAGYAGCVSSHWSAGHYWTAGHVGHLNAGHAGLVTSRRPMNQC
jgi:hypothetical protein